MVQISRSLMAQSLWWHNKRRHLIGPGWFGSQLKRSILKVKLHFGKYLLSNCKSIICLSTWSKINGKCMLKWSLKNELEVWIESPLFINPLKTSVLFYHLRRQENESAAKMFTAKIWQAFSYFLCVKITTKSGSPVTWGNYHLKLKIIRSCDARCQNFIRLASGPKAALKKMERWDLILYTQIWHLPTYICNSISKVHWPVQLCCA
jgi:hypothetical protein